MIRQYLAKRRLAKSLRPDPAYRKRRLAQFTPERAWRYEANALLVHDKWLTDCLDAARLQARDKARRLFWIDAVRLRRG